MAEKLGGSTWNIPNNGKVVDSDWTDDIDKQFAIYGGDETREGEYISPNSIKKETAAEIKSFQEKLTLNTALSSLKKFREKELEKAA